jgi:hypothetical protein
VTCEYKYIPVSGINKNRIKHRTDTHTHTHTHQVPLVFTEKKDTKHTHTHTLTSVYKAVPLVFTEKKDTKHTHLLLSFCGINSMRPHWSSQAGRRTHMYIYTHFYELFTNKAVPLVFTEKKDTHAYQIFVESTI